MSRFSIVKQGEESYASLELVCEGVARQCPPDFVGDITFEFREAFDGQGAIVNFDTISSVLYADELLWSPESYPYFKDAAKKSGLFVVRESTYVSKISVYYPDHLHYVYFDQDFNWHITAKGLKFIAM